MYKRCADLEIIVVLTYPHMLHCALEDAASTFHTSLSLLSGCLGLHYPHYTEHKPDKEKVHVTEC